MGAQKSEVDQITLAYCAVEELLAKIEQECCPEDTGLVAIARICYQHACNRATELTVAVEKETGEIEVLLDNSQNHNIYDRPIRGVLIHRKEAANV